MYFTGFADEAADDIQGQIKATKALGWHYIEARNVNNINIHDTSDAEFEYVADQLVENNITVNCFGSTIANWATQITDDFSKTMEKVERAIPRMQRLKTKLVRIMSFAPLTDNSGNFLDNQREKERFQRLSEICCAFDDAGIIPVHENCKNYGGMGWTFTLTLLENVKYLKLVFDTGNPLMNLDCSKSTPYSKQSPWEFYRNVKDHIVYIHIKDGVYNEEKNDLDYTYPGDGDAEVKRIIKDLLDDGYNGGISIEPHMAVVFHNKSIQSSDSVRLTNYIEYGKRLMDIITEIRYGTSMR